MQADRGFAFVKLDTHEHAAQAICNLQNYQVHGRPIKCSWGKDREGGAGTAAPGAVGSPAMGMPSAGAVQQPGRNRGMMGYPMVSPMMRTRAWLTSSSNKCTACLKVTANTTRDTTTRQERPGSPDNPQVRHRMHRLRSRLDGECKIRQRQHTINRQTSGAPTTAAKLRANDKQNRCNAMHGFRSRSVLVYNFAYSCMLAR